MTWNAVPVKDYPPIEINRQMSPVDRILNRINLKRSGKIKRQDNKIEETNDNTSNTSGELGELKYGQLEDVLKTKYPGLFELGTKPVSPNILRHDPITNKYARQFGVDPNIMRALMSQECYNGVCDRPGAPAWGPGQIEYTLVNEFRAFGLKYFNKPFAITRNKNTDDRLNPEYNIAFACYRFSQDVERYEGDYVKALQAYNFSHYSLNTLLRRFSGNSWLDKRGDIAYYNGHYRRTGSTRYGDKLYVEHVLRYYHP